MNNFLQRFKLNTMHEMSIAMNLVDLAVQTAKQNDAQKINSMVLEMGSLTGVVREALEFCFESACKGTIAEGAKLEIINIPGNAVCEHCGHRFSGDQVAVPCPKCNEYVFNIQGGRELKLKSVNVD
ncbi:MAG: hydrogenase maturation nickel metallochaperone HypA [Calditrichaceae bacterium]|nr:hydrogenase maturation nickel metallochaperone HypA [Calditrichaceae bacterium]